MTYSNKDIMDGLRGLYKEWCDHESRVHDCDNTRLPDYEQMLDELEAHLNLTHVTLSDND